ncbi:hypothetical protein [Mycobacterium phage WXIN]|nr:hypothetical protein [Mycobacterium phage WXIN]
MIDAGSCLECQACGDIVRRLSAEEARIVAERPYDFIVYCYQCKSDGHHRMDRI